MLELVPHTGELEMRVVAPRLEDVLVEALRGLAGEVSDRATTAAAVERRPVRIASSGPDTLLPDLLNEAVYLMEVDGFVATGILPRALGPAELRGDLTGVIDPDARPLVKAATYHRAALRRTPAGWEARVVLDV